MGNRHEEDRKSRGPEYFPDAARSPGRAVLAPTQGDQVGAALVGNFGHPWSTRTGLELDMTRQHSTGLAATEKPLARTMLIGRSLRDPLPEGLVPCHASIVHRGDLVRLEAKVTKWRRDRDAWPYRPA